MDKERPVRSASGILTPHVHVAAFVGFGLVAVPTLADAADLSWQAPAGCPTSSEVTARVERRLRRPLQVPASVRVERSGERYEARVTIAEAERSISAPTCDAAAEAVAVIVSLAAEHPEDVEPTPEPGPASNASPILPPPPGERPIAPAVPSARTTLWSVGAGAAFDSGTLPRPAPGVALAVEARRGSLALGVAFAGFGAQSERAPGDPPVVTSVGLVDAMGMACLVHAVTRVIDAGGCLGAGAGVLFGQTRGVSHPDSGIGVRPQGVALGRLDARLTRLASIHAEAGPLVDPAPSPFRVRGIGDVHRPSPVVARATVGIRVSW